ncbi:Arrestin-N domain-containing protein [Mycena indigotica]|uniref:Arrestin-N domain-containing protein n=1 Tax=Mycena indigotica TaxID=2126181 RepID=A0A8H6RYQ8_9AGAR|nr:Arrestin-N domain-containing protein [Mycena indigotica]KAF7289327.1 Arrestin-N domain-containing protein [Mycena indigotica]
MASLIESTDGPLTLQFQNITRVAGETVQGVINIDYRQVEDDNLEELRVKFRGASNTQITVRTGQTTTTYRSTELLFHTKIPVWKQGSAYPPPGLHILSCPFEFTLPSPLPPSFHCEAYHRSGTIGYSLEVVGQRSGIFRFNRRIRRLIPVIPAATPEQVAIKEALMQGWNGGWKTYARDDKLRRGLWGDYAHSRARLILPDLPSFPIGTPIPLSLIVETDTKPMLRSDALDGPADKKGKPLFPAIPTASSQIPFKLYRWAQVSARRRTRTVEDEFSLLGSLGDPQAVAAVVHTVTPPEWIPQDDNKGKGIWRRSIRFDSTLSIAYAPTYSTQIIQWQYQLRLRVEFPGIGNDLKIEIPITLDSSTACPPPPLGIAGSSRVGGQTYADVLPAGPPPQMMDLPPAYFSGENHDWDDEKR